MAFNCGILAATCLRGPRIRAAGPDNRIAVQRREANMKVFVTVKFALIPFAVSWALLGARDSTLAIWSGLVLSALGDISIFGPGLAIPYTLKWPLDSQETYHWPAPVFGPDTSTGCSVAIDDLR
jgi:hypothetical protein